MVILFDLDDTLVDHTRAALAAVEALFAAHGAALGLSRAAFAARWLELTEQAMDAFARGELTVQGQRRFRVRSMFEREMEDAAVDAIYRAYLDVYEQSWRLFDDVLPCLSALTKHRVGVVSNGGREQQHKKLRATGLAERFEIVLTPDPPLRGKPAPDLFFAAARAFQMHPRDCVYVGDHLERDALAAERAGMMAIWLTREAPACDVPPNVQRISSLAELPKLI